MALRTSLAIALMVSVAYCKADDSPPRSVEAKKAQADYDAAVKKLDEEYQKKVDDVKAKYVAEMDAARKTALAAKDLDEAQRILSAVKDISEETPGNGGFHVIAAWYGWYDKWGDVTVHVRKYVKNGTLRLPQAGEMSSKVGDPAFGQHKSLVILYRVKGYMRIAIVGDDKPVVLPGLR